MDKPVYIYTLSDPNTGRPRYVGLTSDPKHRMTCHISPSHVGKNSARALWIRGLLEQGHRPKLSVVEVCRAEDAAQAEHNWISRLLEQGEILLNTTTDGGEGNSRGRPPKPEGEKYVIKAFRLPPELWIELEAAVPKGERSKVIQAGLRRELARLKRKADHG